MYKFSLFVFSILFSINCFSQSYWLIRNENGEEHLLTIKINPETQTFEAHSRKNALKEIAGTIMYAMAKTAGKIRYPEFIHSDGKISLNGDTTYYTGNYDSVDQSFQLKAKSWKKNFLGSLTDSRNKVRPLTGEKVDSDKPLRDYSSIISNSFLLTEKYFWDANLVKSSDWLSYKRDVSDVKMKIADDFELSITMGWLGKKLSQVPHQIKNTNKSGLTRQQTKVNPLQIIKLKNALLILEFVPSEKDKIDQLFREIQDKKIETLILDASFSRNFGLNSALLLANHLTSKPSDWGIFLTRKWSETENSIPLPSAYEKMLKNPLKFTDPSGTGFNEKGFFLKTDPGTPLFSGKVYLLINKFTMNVAEAFAIYLKNEKIATLVGQKTAGSPVLTNAFEIDNQYCITIPFARFYDKYGKSWVGSGVEPDIVDERGGVNAVLNFETKAKPVSSISVY